jgi:hypothetical protein
MMADYAELTRQACENLVLMLLGPSKRLINVGSAILSGSKASTEEQQFVDLAKSAILGILGDVMEAGLEVNGQRQDEGRCSVCGGKVHRVCFWLQCYTTLFTQAYINYYRIIVIIIYLMLIGRRVINSVKVPFHPGETIPRPSETQHSPSPKSTRPQCAVVPSPFAQLACLRARSATTKAFRHPHFLATPRKRLLGSAISA